MSHVALPSAKVKAALAAAAKEIDDEGLRLTERFRKCKRWSWREFRRVEALRSTYDALRKATEGTFDGMRWMSRKRQFNDAASALLPLCNIAETVEVSDVHFLPIANFYR